ncbi:hypothetical protein ACGFX4_17820 [Kitasatospora sp. NPDC048365]|uniref:hypothetical protein n=1 Tax=Kitasatospora sp. NPDC048365 TaxID=3364050 RepID=UPI003724B647
MDVSRPVRSLGVGPTALLLGIAAAVALVVLAAAGALGAVGDIGTSLTADPPQGRAGSTVKVEGRNFKNCQGDFLVMWDGQEAGAVDAHPYGFGNFSVQFTVPVGAEPGRHWFSARCKAATVDGSPGSPVAAFTVVAAEPAARPQLVVDPPRGAAGQQVTVTGSRFDACAGGSADLWFDTREPGRGATVPVTADGGFTVGGTVPAGLAAGPHTLHAACADRPEAAAEAPFTALEGGTGGIPTDDPASSGTGGGGSGGGAGGSEGSGGSGGSGNGSSGGGGAGLTGAQWGAVLGGAALLAGASGYGLSRRRGPGWVGKHVTAHGRPVGPGRYRVAEATGTAAGSRSHSVRLEPRPDPGTQHLEEGER